MEKVMDTFIHRLYLVLVFLKTSLMEPLKRDPVWVPRGWKDQGKARSEPESMETGPWARESKS